MKGVGDSEGEMGIYVDGIGGRMGSVIGVWGKGVEMRKYGGVMVESVRGGC